MLHAASLGFRHPVGDRPVRFEAPPPDDFRAVLAQLRHSDTRGEDPAKGPREG